MDACTPYACVVPAPRRRAPSRTPEAIAEDLVAARDVGLANATLTHLSETASWLLGLDVSEDEVLQTAQEFLSRHVHDFCKTRAITHADDPCIVAACKSLDVLLTGRREGPNSKAFLVRKRESKETGCHLQADAVRKREDGLLSEVAELAFDDLAESEAERFPTSIPALVHQISEPANALVESLTYLLARFYEDPQVCSTSRSVLKATVQALMDVAHLHGLFQGVLLHLLEPQRRSPVDLYFAVIAYNILSLPFDRRADRKKVAKALLTSDWTPKSFVLLLTEQRGGDQVIVRWQQFLSACYDGCTFHRVEATQRLCVGHRMVAMLDDLTESISEYKEGKLESELVDFFGSFSDYMV